MKEIKFRAWQKFHKKMVEVKIIDFKDGKINSITVKYPKGTCPRIITYTDDYGDFRLTKDGGNVLNLMQFTGLKDKNGKEIYEGDIVRVTAGEYFQGIYEFDGVEVVKDIRDGLEFMYADDTEILGNIHDNPELIPRPTDEDGELL